MYMDKKKDTTKENDVYVGAFFQTCKVKRKGKLTLIMWDLIVMFMNRKILKRLRILGTEVCLI